MKSNGMTKFGALILIGALLLMFALGNCSDSDGEAGGDGDTDADSDTDTDTDTDTDSDTDTDTGTETQTPEECIVEYCMDEVADCMEDEVCSGWMTCIQACGDDPMVCPTFCGMYYPSVLSGDFTNCAVDNECLTIDFSMFPPCETPTEEWLDLSNMEGTWWFAAASDEEYLFDYDCQKFVFAEQSATVLDVAFSVPLSDDSVEQICSTEGTFTRVADGSIEVIYNNYAAYHENWYLIFKSENALLAHLCFASEGDARDYGTLLLTRVPLESMDSGEYDDLNDAVTAHLGDGIESMSATNIVGCANE